MAVSTPTDKRFRRAHVSPGRRRGRLQLSRKGLIYVGLAVVCAVYAGARLVGYVRSSGVLTVTQVTISGNARLSRGEVLSLLDGLQGQNMLLVDLDEWRDRLLASPWVADAALRRMLPREIDIEIFERQPIGVGRFGDALYLIDEDGGVIDEFGPPHADLDLPVIDGLSSVREPRSSSPLVDEERAALARRLIVSLQRRPDLASRVSEIDVSNPRNAAVVLKGDTALIRLGDDQFAERLQSYLDLQPALRDHFPGIDTIDLRFGERFPIRPQASASRSAKGGGYQ